MNMTKDMKKEKLSTKIAAIFICIAVTVSMISAAPVRAAENEAAQADQQTEQTVQTEEAAQTEAAEETSVSASTETAAGTEAATTETTAAETVTETAGSGSSASDAAAAITETASEGASKIAKKSVEIQAPDEVDNVKAVAKKRGKTVITWTPVKDADGYYIYKATKKNGKYKKLKKLKGENRKKYTHKYKKLKKNKKYYYKVYAYKVVDGDIVRSETADKDAAKNTLSYKKKYTMKATAYSGGGLCANGKRCRVGRVAVDPDVIPLGTWLYVKGYGFCQACDTGGAIQGNRIDLYFNSESKCNDYGVQKTKVYVLRK